MKKKNEIGMIKKSAGKKDDSSGVAPIMHSEEHSPKDLGDAPSPIASCSRDATTAEDGLDERPPSEHPSKVLVNAFSTPSPNATPKKLSMPSAPAPELLDTASAHEPAMPPQVLDSIPIELVGNPIKALGSRLFKSNGILPTGFPEVRDLTNDVKAGKIPVKGQSRFARVDILNTDPLVYHDTQPLPPKDLLAALVPAPQILLYGDGLPNPGFLRSFSLADLPNFEWGKLVGLVTFVLLPNFAPFQDEAPFFSHRSIIKNIVNMLWGAKKTE